LKGLLFSVSKKMLEMPTTSMTSSTISPPRRASTSKLSLQTSVLFLTKPPTTRKYCLNRLHSQFKTTTTRRLRLLSKLRTARSSTLSLYSLLSCLTIQIIKTSTPTSRIRLIATRLWFLSLLPTAP
jgi:hypothetical protein